MPTMRIEIVFVDFQNPPLSEEIGENEVDNMVDDLSRQAGVEWMSLNCFVRHLRNGKFGNNVKVNFSLNPDGKPAEGPGVITYYVVAEEAPTNVYIDVLLS